MRNFLAIILAMIAGLTTVFGLVSWKLSDVIHQPEPIQTILDSGEAAEDFKAAIPEALGNMTVGATGVDIVDETINRVVTEASGQIVSEEGFDQAWSQSLELTRTGWIDDIHLTGQTLKIKAGSETEVTIRIPLEYNKVLVNGELADTKIDLDFQLLTYLISAAQTVEINWK